MTEEDREWAHELGESMKLPPGAVSMEAGGWEP